MRHFKNISIRCYHINFLFLILFVPSFCFPQDASQPVEDELFNILKGQYKAMTQEQKKLLAESRKLWLNYQDAELKFKNNFYGDSKTYYMLSFVQSFFIRKDGSEKSAHAIDKWLDECTGKPEGMSTLGTQNCLAKAREMWDKDLNSYYKTLQQRLSAKQKKLLKESQQLWIKLRDTHVKFLCDVYYNSLEGTMWRIFCSDETTAFTKRRALELQGYLIDSGYGDN